MPFDRDQMRQKAQELAANGVFIGTSSWKYPGWRGMLYDQVKEANAAARKAGKALVTESKAASPNRKTFIYVNNWLEGNALETIAAMLETDQ